MENFIDTTLSLANIPSGSAYIDALDNIPVGTSDQTRQGRVVWLQKLYCKWSFDLNTQASVSPLGDLVRMMIFIDKQSQGGLPATTDVLQTASVLAHYNWDNRDRFDVLYDHTIDLNQQIDDGALGTGILFKYWEAHVPLNREQVYQGISTTVFSNQVVQLIIATSGGATNNTTSSRLFYFTQ